MNRISVIKDNDGAEKIPIICLHGFLESKEMWSNLHLFFSDRPIYALDIPGHGQSELDELSDCSISNLAQMIIEALDLLRIDCFVLIGHSMGGYIGLEILHKIPNRVDQLILLNSNYHADSPEKKIDRMRSIQVLRKFPKIYFKKAFESLFLLPEKWEKEILELSNEASKIKHFAILFSLEAIMERKDNSNLVSQFQEKVFMIQGREDGMFMEPSIHKSTLDIKHWIVIENSKHMSVFEQNEEVMWAISQCLVKKI